MGRMGLPVGGGIGGIVLLLLFSALTGQNPLDMIGGVDRAGDGERRHDRRSAGRRPAGASSSASCSSDTEDDLAARSSASAARPTRRRRSCSSPTPRSRRAASASRRWGPSTARRSQGLSGPVVLPGARSALRRAGRLRPGLRGRARSRASHPDADRAVAAGQRARQRRGERRGQRAVGAAGAAGRLLRRRVGPLRRAAGTCSTRAMPKKGCAPPRRSATTGCSGRRRAAWCPSRSRTARPSSA